jgi:hypothetical protein
MTDAPSSCAGVLAKLPLNEPTGVRAALAITMEDEGMDIFSRILARDCQSLGRKSIWPKGFERALHRSTRMLQDCCARK